VQAESVGHLVEGLVHGVGQDMRWKAATLARLCRCRGRTPDHARPPTQRQEVAYRLVDGTCIIGFMSTQIAIRLDDDELEALDREVKEGSGS